MIIKLQNLKGKTEVKIYQLISKFYDEMNFRRQSGNVQFEGDLFSKSVQGISKVYHEVLLLRKLLQTIPQVKKMNIKSYDVDYTIMKNRDQKEIVDDKYENNENGYINF